jgi:GntR family transcriptional regulator
MMHFVTPALHSKTLDRYNGEKLYLQLTRIFLEEIHSGRWCIDQRIPSEEELCSQYEVSKITVRQAINNLVSDGYIVKIQGKGTFVRSVLPVVGLSMKTRFTEEMFGKEVTAHKEILQKGVQEPPGDVRGYLSSDGAIYQVLSRRIVNSEPTYIDDSFIPLAMLPGVEKSDLTRASLYALLQENGTKKIFKVVQTVEIVLASEGQAMHLDVSSGVPVLAVHRLLISSDNSPVAYTRLLGRSDRYKFQTEFERLR